MEFMCCCTATSMYPDEMQLCICSVEENMASTKKVCSTFAKFRQDKKVVTPHSSSMFLSPLSPLPIGSHSYGYCSAPHIVPFICSLFRLLVFILF